MGLIMRLAAISLLLTACGVKPASTKAAEDSECGASIPVPAVPAVAGQLVVSMPSTVNPCKVSGYVVGYKAELKVERTDDGNFVINSIPAGQLDVIITGSSAASGLFLDGSDQDRGIRLKDVKILSGLKTNAGEIALPKMGSLAGKVLLNGQSDHAGIDVYIPGTEYIAKTDSEGHYAFTAIPVGEHNLYFDKDGFHRGQLEAIAVKEAAETVLDDVTLVLSTGAEGFVLIENGLEIVNHRTVSLIIGATPDATLMKLSEQNTFDDVSWQPMASAAQYTFATEGSKKLYIKFADANGLESSPFSDAVTIDLFGSSEGSFTLNAGATYSIARSVNLAINLPVNAKHMMICENASFTACAWEDAAASKVYTFANDGSKILYAKYQDADDFESPATSATIIVDTAAPNVASGFALYNANTKNVLAWADGGGGSAGYLVVGRSTAAVSFTPVNGTVYTAAQDLGNGETVKAATAALTFTDTGLTNGSLIYYAVYPYDSAMNYGTAVSGSSTPTMTICGGAGDGCYNDLGAISDLTTLTPTGKVIDYVYANGSSGIKVWREQGGTRVLRANGSDEWALGLNLNGKGQSGSAFADVTSIYGRVCPPNVYVDDSNKFTTGNCLYYTQSVGNQPLNNAGTSQSSAGSIGLGDWTNYTTGISDPRWYVGNVELCSVKGMRLPTLYETNIPYPTADSAYLPATDGSPTFAGALGLAGTGVATWTATSTNQSANKYWNLYVNWGGGYTTPYGASDSVICVLP